MCISASGCYQKQDRIKVPVNDCLSPPPSVPVPLPLPQEMPRYHELPTLEEREAAGEAGPSLEDEYLDQINPIYDALSFAATDEEEALASLPTDKAFVMSRAMYV